MELQGSIFQSSESDYFADVVSEYVNGPQEGLLRVLLLLQLPQGLFPPEEEELCDIHVEMRQSVQEYNDCRKIKRFARMDNSCITSHVPNRPFCKVSNFASMI